MQKVIGITGRKRHGKDTVARELVLNGFKVLRFADPLKEMLRAFYRAHDLVESEIERRLEGDLKEHPCIYLNGRSPRYAMQTLGTEWGRDLIDNNLWVDSLHRRASLHDKVAVPDVRFDNECAKIHEMDGKIVRVDASKRVPEDTHSNHSSETGIGKLPADLEIDNNGTPFELQHAIKAMLSFSV